MIRSLPSGKVGVGFSKTVQGLFDVLRIARANQRGRKLAKKMPRKVLSWVGKGTNYGFPKVYKKEV